MSNEEILRDIGFNDQTIDYITSRFLCDKWSDHQTLSGKVKKTRARKKPYYIPSNIVDDVTETVHIENSMLKFVA